MYNYIEVNKMTRISLTDIRILFELIEGDHNTQTTGMAFKDFMIKQTITNITRRLVFLESNGYVRRGFPKGKATTFYITEEGMKFYKEATKPYS